MGPHKHSLCVCVCHNTGTRKDSCCGCSAAGILPGCGKGWLSRHLGWTLKGGAGRECRSVGGGQCRHRLGGGSARCPGDCAELGAAGEVSGVPIPRVLSAKRGSLDASLLPLGARGGAGAGAGHARAPGPERKTLARSTRWAPGQAGPGHVVGPRTGRPRTLQAGPSPSRTSLLLSLPLRTTPLAPQGL